MPLIFTLIWNALLIAQWIVLAQALMSWLINFQVLNIRQPLVYKLWSFLGRILEPVYAPIRRMLPSMSGVDFSPLVVLIGIMVLKQLLLRNQMAFY
ncbi:YggT family protein [Cypionkella sp.]|jgi:YggT family protein|uniref:YggT family protein n=1 Tax=Cypionkella sp. TaxID=2811411 RepID=UPI002749F9D2|nr:YggT family protein [Cypionkella sp.]